jgi:RNA polymerase sigma-70 factor (ECF subfamily)
MDVRATAQRMTRDGASGAEVPPASGAPAEFERLYAEHFAFVWRNLRRLGVAPASLDDAAQDVFLVVHRRQAEIRAGALRPFLFSVVRRVAADHRRSLGRHDAAPLDEAPEPASGAPDPERGLERAEAARLVHRVLARVSDEQREVFVLAELETMAAPEIAVALGIPLNTVYSRLRAARAAFEKEAARVVARQGRAR